MNNEDRFNELYNQYDRLVWTYLNKNIINRQDREDVHQLIWLGIWSSIDKIEPGKEHAFLYRVTMNQIHKLYYYSSRDFKNTTRSEKVESSEGTEFNILDITDELDKADDFAYFELLDEIESVLTEEEYNYFIALYQGFITSEIRDYYKVEWKHIRNVFTSIKEKLTAHFGQEVVLPFSIRVINRVTKSKSSGPKGKHWKLEHGKRVYYE